VKSSGEPGCGLNGGHVVHACWPAAEQRFVATDGQSNTAVGTQDSSGSTATCATRLRSGSGSEHRRHFVAVRTPSTTGSTGGFWQNQSVADREFGFAGRLNAAACSARWSW
jgi:hypothetical protein